MLLVAAIPLLFDLPFGLLFVYMSVFDLLPWSFLVVSDYPNVWWLFTVFGCIIWASRNFLLSSTAEALMTDLAPAFFLLSRDCYVISVGGSYSVPISFISALC